MEHCGDDFLAALGESMQDSEDWDDLQAMESEAFGTLADIFDKDILNNFEDASNVKARSKKHVMEDSAKSEKRHNLVQLDSSSDSEDLDFITQSKRNIGSTPSCCTERSGQSLTQSLHRHPSKSVVGILNTFIRNFLFLWRHRIYYASSLMISKFG